MEIITSRFGKIEYSQEEVIEFPDGLLGFSEDKHFIILNTQGKGPFRWLQSLDNGDLAFIIIEPLNFMFSFDLEISDEDAQFLGITRPEEVLIYVIVNIPENPRDMTANLQGPIVINVTNRRARQVISTNPEHGLKTRIIDEMAKREAKLLEASKLADSNEKEGGK